MRPTRGTEVDLPLPSLLKRARWLPCKGGEKMDSLLSLLIRGLAFLPFVRGGRVG